MPITIIPTVLGPITPDQLGYTFCHEHLLFTIAAAHRTVPPGVSSSGRRGRW